MPSIKILSESLRNKISAGEVIERPASVVKELIENSIDAKSTRIDIEIRSAGKRLIKVADNGLGMSKNDLPMSLLPHATVSYTHL
ncbi:MAG: ATP-binding protein, partial [Thermodesulfovibrionales bacterium]|nr:ATP-binding protein [Thermodesulfovibrionales bacterium]